MLEVRPFSHRDARFRDMLSRGQFHNRENDEKATRIIRTVCEEDGAGLLRCVQEEDSPAVGMDSLRVPEDEIAEARGKVSEKFLTSICLARVNARKYHEYQRRRGYVCDDDGVILSRRVRPLRRVGICCGGSYSALLTHAVPAIMAGVGEIAVAAAPGPDGEIDPRILATAKVLGIGEVYRMSGAHAVAAFAFGAGPVGKVDKIVGPGGPLASAAKKLLTGYVGVDTRCDMAELAVIADSSANAKFIAVDFLAQAEQDAVGMLALFTTDRLVGEAVRIEMDRLVDLLPNAGHIRANLSQRTGIYVCRDMDAAIDAVNELAPARLALQTMDNEEYLSDIETAGAVFVGPWSSETAGGFYSGVNPHFPDCGQARFGSGLGVDDFVREMAVVEYGPDRLLRTGRHQIILAEEEGLPARAEAVRERLELLKLTVE